MYGTPLIYQTLNDHISNNLKYNAFYEYINEDKDKESKLFRCKSELKMRHVDHYNTEYIKNLNEKDYVIYKETPIVNHKLLEKEKLNNYAFGGNNNYYDGNNTYNANMYGNSIKG